MEQGQSGKNHDQPVHTLTLDRDTTIHEAADDRTGVVRLHADARTDLPASDALCTTGPLVSQVSQLTAVPYFSWANRGSSDMTVWIRDGGPAPTSLLH